MEEKQYKPRKVTNVLTKILLIIPDSEKPLINALKKFENSLSHKAPELLRSLDCWVPFIEILNRFIPIKESEWHLKIKEILENKQ
jgi:hypothetical protein